MASEPTTRPDAGASDAPPLTAPASDADAAAADAALLDKKRKKRDKVRSAWISFAGRIIAQVVGAIAAVFLGVLVLHRYAERPAPGGPDATASSARVRQVAAGAPRAIAVLPLANYSGDGAQEHFADALTEAITADLARLDGLRVISRTSSMRYKGERKPLTQIAGELGVDLVLEGSIVKDGARVRLTAQLIDARTDEHVWVETYDRTIGDVLALQAEIASAISRDLKGVVAPAQVVSQARLR